MNFKVRIKEVKVITAENFFKKGEILEVKDGKIEGLVSINGIKNVDDLKEKFPYLEVCLIEEKSSLELLNTIEKEKIIIKNRDFSVLEGLESVNKWGYNFEITNITKHWIEYYLTDEIGQKRRKVVELSDVSDEYIKDNLNLLNLEIEFQDVKEINSFEEFQKFLRDKELCFGGRAFAEKYKANSIGGNNIGVWKSKSVIEEEFNVKINLDIN